MIWIIGGTSEARKLVTRLDDIDDFVVTSATEGSREFIKSDRMIVGRMNKVEMLHFVEEHKISLIVDLTHPYAKIVSANAKEVSKIKNIRYIRYERAKSKISSDAVYLDSLEECIEYLKNIKGTVFFTTGSKNIVDFEKIRGENRYIYRVLPALDSIEECKKNNVKMKDIVAVLGPFSYKLNKAMFSEYKSNYVVMKDSGKGGGTEEKIRACVELGITAIVIGREMCEGIDDLDVIENIIREENFDGKLI
ncbi:precorrin-6A reductase [Anaerosalibacter sp. Marseille-P3206]|uniref:precorrin-6A reductase n=1 Tax=Anaerosalibacter sp. Marseille-P3206 TaxID=1871005 RepID=UPI0009861FEB|nr:precorrin-6A reductase [Anaerosalibacter sp. Marseille-P3206]